VYVPHKSQARQRFTADYRTYDPLGRIPALAREDGQLIYDSLVIISYLDILNPRPKLIPEDNDRRVTMLRLHALGNGMLDIATAAVGERFRPIEQQSQLHLARWRTKLQTCVDAVE
jgi:glutathione S-transferase